ncbi:stage II sporulation protein M [Candidatus Pacearchaeota archaeon]|nr:stage II sporulation protein M [Candidatus Pacearchaeota archaeon]
MAKKVRSSKKNNFNIFAILLIAVGFLIIILNMFFDINYLDVFGFIIAYFGGLMYFLSKEGENYKKSWRFLKESKNYILFAIVLFLGFMILGFLYQPGFLIEAIKKIIEELLEKTKDLNFLEMLWFIFYNNTSVSFFSIILGFFFSIFPAVSIAFNGYVIGFILQKSIIIDGLGVFWKLVPHGIFELPAVFISIALGIRFGSFIFNRAPSKAFKFYFKNSMRVFLFVVVPLLVIAAIIETSLIFLVK